MWRLALAFALLVSVNCGGASSSSQLATNESSGTAVTGTAVPTEARIPIARAPWQNVPKVTIVSARADDPRIPQVLDAIAFWNQTLGELGSAFRFGEVRQVTQRTPDSLLMRLSQAILAPGTPMGGFVLTRGDYESLTQGMDKPDFVVMLSDSAFVSFSTGIVLIEGRTQSLVAIRSVIPVLAQPNVMPNLIAHEIGHSLGISHNADPSMLMCGRPAECRPDTFASQTPRWFPLNEAEKSRLLGAYPANWKPTP